TTSVNPMLGYRFQNTVARFGLNASVNLNQFTSTTETVRWGFTVGANKGLLDNQLQLNGAATYDKINVDGAPQNTDISSNTRLGYTIKERHNINLALQFVSRNNLNAEEEAIRDVLGNLGYTFNFGRN